MEFVERDEKKVTLDIAATIVAKKIEEKAEITLKTWSLSEETEQMLDMVLEKILFNYNRRGYKTALYTMIKELAINGTKANFKSIFFKEKGLNHDSPEDYEQGIVDYKSQFSEEFAEEYGIKSRNLGVYVRVTFYHNDEHLRIIVENNTSISDIDKARINEKRTKALQYNDLTQFYMEAGDETEGAGMGFALICILLRGVGIDPSQLMITNANGSTEASISIPFN